LRKQDLVVPDPANAAPYLRGGLKLDLSGHVALVTGSTGELGRVIARTLAACGADVAVHYHQSEQRASLLQRELLEFGVRSCTVQADVTSAQSIDALRANVSAQLGTVDILVNNAISWHPEKPVLDQSLDAFEAVYRTSVVQAVMAAKAFVPAMIERRWGRVIAISSEVAMQALPQQAAYTSGKRALDGVMRTLAREVGEHQITVNQVAPGWMISDRDRSAGSERNVGYEGWVPLRRRGYDQDVANAVAFLASDLAAFVTGVYLPVCGGNVMPGI
jgi:3-oxoacyl-[acyl-carrier protein] reductase